MKEKIMKFIEDRDIFMKEILDIIGYGSGNNNSPIEFDDKMWQVYDDELRIAANKDATEESMEDGDCYAYTISSYSAKGEQLFMGEKDGYTFIMAYPEDERWNDTTIFILDNKNKI